MKEKKTVGDSLAKQRKVSVKDTNLSCLLTSDSSTENSHELRSSRTHSYWALLEGLEDTRNARIFTYN